MENQHDKPDDPRGAGGPESPVHVAKDEGERDHELFAHESASHESEIVAPEAALETAVSQRPSRRSRRPFENRAAFGKNSPCC